MTEWKYKKIWEGKNNDPKKNDEYWEKLRKEAEEKMMKMWAEWNNELYRKDNGK